MVQTTFRIEPNPRASEADGALARGDSGKPDISDDYARQNVFDIAKGRCGWLVMFCLGLLLSALIVQRFEDLLEHHVQLSFFVPLIMGHGGNTGSQTVSTIIRALALRQLSQRDLLRTVIKEGVAGGLMGGLIGGAIMMVSLVWPDIGPGVGLTVGVSLPIISMWANAVGALLTMVADRFKMDPAVTSVPLMTTIVDATGLVIYFYIAEIFLDMGSTLKEVHAAHTAAVVAAGVGKVGTAGASKAAAGAGKVAGKAAATAAAVAGNLAKKLFPPSPALPRKGGRGL